MMKSIGVIARENTYLNMLGTTIKGDMINDSQNGLNTQGVLMKKASG